MNNIAICMVLLVISLDKVYIKKEIYLPALPIVILSLTLNTHILDVYKENYTHREGFFN